MAPSSTRTEADIEAPNALHAQSPEGASWSSINLAEAVPGVMTPLCASAWVPASELGLRSPFVAMGALPKAEAGVGVDPQDRITNAFYGRMAVRVDFLCRIGDLIPGQSGEALARDFFGFVPPDFVSRPSLRRLPAIALRYPRTLAGIARKVERLRSETDAWWREEIPKTSQLNLESARARLQDANARFAENLAAQAIISACAIQPVHEQLTGLAEVAGVESAALLRGTPHEESVVLDDLWAVSRGDLDLDTFLARHGYHGPGEGEVETVVWREDPASVRQLVEQYAGMPDSAGPRARDAEHLAERDRAERRLLESLGPLGRTRARLVLRLARRFVPLRGVGKVAYLQSIDVLRATARHLGSLLAANGTIDDPADVFYLTVEELTEPAGRPTDVRALVAERRADRDRYRTLSVPTAWTGQPVPLPAEEPTDASATDRLTGIGASTGIVEGRAVVVLDPAEAEVDEGDILVAHTTDPAWVSLMFVSAGLVVDIGGLMSHAAVVARELDIPCVMNTGHGTTALRTGDLIRVDGAAGTVDVVTRNPEENP